MFLHHEFRESLILLQSLLLDSLTQILRPIRPVQQLDGYVLLHQILMRILLIFPQQVQSLQRQENFPFPQVSSLFRLLLIPIMAKRLQNEFDRLELLNKLVFLKHL